VNRAAPEFFTIGAYGSAAERYFATLTDAKIDTFCDIRARRGVRGSEYAFVNSTRLQNELAKLDIRYLHIPELAPSKEIRNRQGAIDKAARVAKRKRAELGEEFAIGYQETILSTFVTADFLAALPPDARRVVLFCVERDPAACHRSLLSARLEQDLGISVTHLLP
jgi:uncharacterized protein (DUF488 family)